MEDKEKITEEVQEEASESEKSCCEEKAEGESKKCCRKVQSNKKHWFLPLPGPFVP